MKLLIIDANEKGATFEWSLSKSGKLKTRPTGRDRGFGKVHTDRAEIDVDRSVVELPGNVWRCFEGTIGEKVLFRMLSRAGGIALVRAFVERFTETGKDDEAEILWNSMLEAEKSNTANDEFASYEFGDGVKVVESDNWDTNERLDYTKIVYVKYDDDAIDSDSHRMSFHVRFNKYGQVKDAYALDLDSGNDVGYRGSAQMAP